MGASARQLDATLVSWDLPDVDGSVDDVLAAWSQHEGSQDLLLQKLVAALEQIRPRALVTFDPRNGVTCHPAHRVAAALAVQASTGVTFLPPSAIHMVASRQVISLSGGTPYTAGFVPYVPDDPQVYTYDATRTLSRRPGTAWDWLLKTVQAYPSQQSQVVVDAYTRAPFDQRKLFLLRMNDASSTDTRYHCP